MSAAITHVDLKPVSLLVMALLCGMMAAGHCVRDRLSIATVWYIVGVFVAFLATVAR